MSESRRTLGALGEALAARHLEAAGYRIVGRNVRAGGVEIDLIAARGRLRVFVEVKARRGRRHGPPEEAVGPHKRARIVRGARAWLREQPQRGLRVRFDVVCLEPDEAGVMRLRHWPGAFDAAC